MIFCPIADRITFFSGLLLTALAFNDKAGINSNGIDIIGTEPLMPNNPIPKRTISVLIFDTK